MRKSLALVGVIVIVAFAFGLRVGHPHQGLNSAMGSANSSIVIYKHVGQALPGDKVLIDVKGIGLALGVVRSAHSGSVDVDSVSSFTRVKQSEVHGKLVAIVPFFGIPLGWVGL